MALPCRFSAIRSSLEASSSSLRAFSRRRGLRSWQPARPAAAQRSSCYLKELPLDLGQMVWFAETWAMQDVRRVWPCLVKPAQRYIACFETLAQLALLQATHSHIGGGRYSFSMPSGTDNSAAEAGINKLFTASWPLQVFVQLVASWAHAKNVLLQPTHLPGRYNDWAESPRAFRPPPGQSCALQPCQPCTSWKGHHTLPRRGTMAPRTSGCSRRACVTYGLLAGFRKPVWLATAPRARLLHLALQGFSAARIPGCDGRV